MKKNKTIILRPGDTVVVEDGVCKSGGKLFITIPNIRGKDLTNCIEIKLVHDKYPELELGTLNLHPHDKRELRIGFSFLN